MKAFSSFLAAALCAWLAAAPLGAETRENIIKFATLAPEGSTWMKVMKEWDRELREKSGGRLKFRIYSGGVAGDEKDVVRKIRLGQLHAGGFTGVGLGEIAPEVRLLDAPFLFRNAAEADHVYKAFEPEWTRAFEKSGYVFLGWAEVGFVYFFTSKPVKSLADLKGVKMWMWEGDPIAEAAFKALDISPIPLSIADVMTSLQTGLIDGVYSSPLAAVALQWFTRTRNMYDLSLANAAGAVLISKKSYDKLPKDLQQLLVSTGRAHMARLTELSRKENLASVQVLKKNGVKVSPARKGEDLESVGRNARRMLAGKLYDAGLLSRVEKSLVDFRTGKK